MSRLVVQETSALSPSSSFAQSQLLLSFVSSSYYRAGPAGDEQRDGMQCRCRTQCRPRPGIIHPRLDPSSPDAISLVADRTGFIGPSAGGLHASSNAPAAGCARTLTGESSRGLEVVGWGWDMNPSTMMKFRAAALPLGCDTSRKGLGLYGSRLSEDCV